MKSFLKNNERGSALIWTMMLMSLFFITISTVTVLMIAEVKQSTRMDDSSLAYLAAEAGVERIKNYTANSEPVIKTGFMDSSSQVQYSIRVVKGEGTTPADGAKYDSPERYCYKDTDNDPNTNRYCYYSQGTVVGGVTRKIDGEKQDVSSSQAKGINLSGTTGSPPINILSATGFPICATCSEYVAPTASNNTFIFKGVVEKVGEGDSNDHVFGLTDNGNLKGIGLKIGTGGLSIVDRQHPETNLTTTPIPVASLNKIRFTLTYRTGGTTPSVSVMVKDENYKCKGVETAFGYSEKFIPTQMFFSSGATITGGAVFEGSTTSTLIGQYNFDDIITFRQSDGVIIVALNNKSGHFSPDPNPPAWHNGPFAPTPQKPMVGDFDGGGKDDIITFRQSDGKVIVALSNGSSKFLPDPNPPEWHAYFAPTGETPAVGDFNGDGKDDIVTFQNQWENVANPIATSTKVWVALSDGSKFGTAGVWHDSFGRAGEKTMTGHFNDDDFEDIITFQNNSVADVYVSLSNGSNNFYGTGSGRWYQGFGYTGQVPMVGDFNGDGFDDIVTFRQSDGKVIVALNNKSNGFNNATEWVSDFSTTGQKPKVGDFNGDGKDDIISFRQSSDGKVIVALSNGTNGFNTGTEWHSYFSPSPQTPMIGNFNGLDPVYAMVNKGINIKGLYFEYR